MNDPTLRDRLQTAVSGKGAFRRFKDVLARDRAELERFFAFGNERKPQRAREWLADEGYVPAGQRQGFTGGSG